MTDKTYICTVIQADREGGEFVFRHLALFRVTTWDPSVAAAYAGELWDEDTFIDKSDTLAQPLFVEVAEEGSDRINRYRVSSVVQRTYSTQATDLADPWPSNPDGGSAGA